MRIKYLLLLILLTALAPLNFGQSKPPSFKKYAVKIEKIKSVRVNLKSHANAKTYRTNLRNAAKGAVNFAGHYIVASWGCGTNCSQSAIIDARTGRVFFPDELAGIADGFCELPADTGPNDLPNRQADSEAPIFYKADSRLLVLKGYKGGDFNDKNSGCGVFYLEWTGAKFKQVKFAPGKRSETP